MPRRVSMTASLVLGIIAFSAASPPGDLAFAAPASALPTTAAPAQGWALEPLIKPHLPPNPTGNPIDALASRSANPTSAELPPEADRRTLLRRLMVDLHGLLPTPGEIDAFESDPDPFAFEHWVDRLLASPRYGERWARHWLDVVHFAETHGHDQDRPRESAWPYRDYLIDSLNADKPFVRFVLEQVAADALFPDQPELIPALGFLAAGPWDESSLRDIREDTVDREIGRYLDRDDIVANVMSTFAGVTAHCARCHDHKFDPIPQSDYYALQAVFAGTEKAERLYDPDPAVHARRQAWMKIQVALDRRDAAALDRLLPADLREDQLAWEQTVFANPTVWQVIRPARWAAREGTELRQLEDDSLLALGSGPPADVYEVTTRLEPPGPASVASPATQPRPVTAVRLEVLADESLPKNGPGRAENGNFHLTGIEMWWIADGASGESNRLVLVNPSADTNQEGWDIAKATDDDPKSGWGIHPAEGSSHVAVFELGTPPPADSAGQLVFVLKQEHGRHHTLGRFRLAVTRDPPPIRASSLPPAVAAALARPPEGRSAAERFELTAFYLSGRAARELAQLPAPRRVYAGASVFPANGNQKPVTRPREVRRLRRGEISQPQELAEPGALSCVSGLPSRFGMAEDEGARRAALAQWLIHRDNPLVWRTVVNRLWHYHFGRGIVDTPGDLGRMGGQPSNRELLDWLAVTFRDDLGGSWKRLHRLIVTSRTWRQTAADSLSAAPLQPLRRRLDAETFRDSLLRLTGRLDLTMGGPSVKQFAMSDGIHVTPRVDYAAYDVDTPGNHRRAIYRFLFRTLPDPLMDTLDCPAGDQSAPTRTESYTALQAFALLNHPLVVRQCEHLAARAKAMATGPDEQRLALFGLVLLRSPSPAEDVLLADYAARHGLANLARLLLNSNEFHFVN